MLESMIDHRLVQPEPTSGCWIWTGWVGKKGHGYVNIGGKLVLTHRHSWALERGAIPEGQWVLHKCNNASCCNPDHLYLGTHADNMRDMQVSGRRKWKTHGERSGRARLTESAVLEIRRQRAAGICAELAANMFRVSKSCIQHAASGRNWRHI